MSMPEPMPHEPVTRADLDSALAALRADIRAGNAELRVEMERMRTETARGETRLLWRLLGGGSLLALLFRYLPDLLG